VRLILDASVAASWLLHRTDPREAALAQQAVEFIQEFGAHVPAIWHLELTNALLLAERHSLSTQRATTMFLADLATLSISIDAAEPHAIQPALLNLARPHELTAYDASYLELAIRTASTLATFDRKLGEAARQVGVSVFGDAAQ